MGETQGPFNILTDDPTQTSFKLPDYKEMRIKATNNHHFPEAFVLFWSIRQTKKYYRSSLLSLEALNGSQAFSGLQYLYYVSMISAQYA